MRVAEYTREDYYDDDWKRRAACRDDTRFTWRKEWLAPRDWMHLKLTCDGCPVFGQCAQWADDEQATDVFAAGEWKESDECLEPA